MATEILRPHDILISVASQIRHNYRRPQSNSNSNSKSKSKPKPPFRKSSPKPPTADAAAAAKVLKNRKTKLEELYAGSGFSISPAPSSVPLPSFRVIRREASPPPEKQAVDYVATRNLRRILRLL